MNSFYRKRSSFYCSRSTGIMYCKLISFVYLNIVTLSNSASKFSDAAIYIWYSKSSTSAACDGSTIINQQKMVNQQKRQTDWYTRQWTELWRKKQQTSSSCWRTPRRRLIYQRTNWSWSSMTGNNYGIQVKVTWTILIFLLVFVSLQTQRQLLI